MNGKFIGIVIGAVVAIMLVGSLLIPAIDNANTKTEHDVPLPVGGQQIYFRFSESEPAIGNTFYTVELSNGNVTITDNANSMTITIPVDTDTLYYASNAGIIKSTDGTTLSFIGSSGVAKTGTKLLLSYGGGQIRVSNTTDSATVGAFSWYVKQPVLNAPTAVSKNRIWTDNPPTENVVKTFTFGGVSYTMAVGYIGDVTVTDESGWHGILAVIPVVLLASLLVSVAFVAFRRQY